MLSVAPMNAGRAAYHERSLGHGLDDYYSQWGERAGHWWGGGADLLGLEGVADSGSIHALIDGRDPHSGLALRRQISDRMVTRRVYDPETGGVAERLVELKRVGGWDFALSAPKSVSLVLAFGDQGVRGEVLAAHRAAVTAALEMLEREAIRVRVGSGGLTRHQTHGLLAVVIEHAWARQVSEDAAPDPQLHTHVVVANMAKSSEDEAPLWRALDMQPVLREWKIAVGATYQAVLRHEVTARLGWEWTEPRNGLAELKAWPTPVLRAFSRRREQIEAFLAGETPTWARAQVATIRTRRAKQHERDERQDLAAAISRFEEFVGAPLRARLLARGSARVREIGARELGLAFAKLISEHGLTAREASFTRGDVVRELAFALGSVPNGEVLARAADRFLAGSRIVQLENGRYSTREIESAQRAVDQAAHHTAPRHLVLSADAADRGIRRVEALRGFEFGEEQRALVRGVVADPATVVLVRAVAGSGKTTSLAAVAAAYEAAGIPVAGVAPTGAAARVMTESGVPARTAERALRDYAYAVDHGVRPTSGVVLVDEAGTIGVRTLAQLSIVVERAGGKLVLVGDDAQLPPVAAGTSYQQLIDEGRVVHELRTPRRFVTPEGREDLAEARALARLRTGDLEGAAAFLHHKQASGAVSVLNRASAFAHAADWHARQIASGLDPSRVALIARSNAIRQILNERARAGMRASGRLGEDVTSIAPVPLAVGDVVVARKNDHRIGIANGTRGRITAITSEAVTIATTDSRSLAIPLSQTKAVVLEHAYAITGHLAQGSTVDAAMIVAPPHHHTKQWSYTALSRSRSRSQLVVLIETPADQPAEHRTPTNQLDEQDALTRIAACLTRDEVAAEQRTRPAPALQMDRPLRAPPRFSKPRGAVGRSSVE